MKKGMDEGAAAAQATETLGRITASTDMHALKDVDLVVEAIAENKELKLKFHKQLGGVVQPGAIFASNTSSLQITGMAEARARPTIRGLYFFNPVQMMKLVEVIRTDHTTNEVFEKMLAFGQRIGKTTVSCVDTPGFIVNRLWCRTEPGFAYG